MEADAAKEKLLEIKKLDIFKELKKQKVNFLNFYGFIVGKIQDPPAITKVYFTPHNLQHCIDVLNIINKLYKNFDLNESEVFVLLIGVFAHDIGMSTLILDEQARKTHMDTAAERISEFRNDQTYSEAVNATYDEAIKQICLAHSDSERLINLDNMEDIQILGANLRIKVLGSLLRFADELDICAERVGKEPVKYGDDEKRDKELEYSQSRWEQLLLFAFPRIEDSTITLNINPTKYNELKDRKGKYAPKIFSSKDLARENYKKIKDCYEYIYNYLREYNFEYHIKISCSDSSIKEEIESVISSFLLPEKIRETEARSANNSKSKITVINSELNKEVAKLVEQNNLLMFGHYRYSSNTNDFCCRDYINTAKIIQELNHNNKIENAFSQHIKSRLGIDLKETAIIGLNSTGMILAAAIGFDLGVKFACIRSVDAKDEEEKENKKFLQKEFHDIKNFILIFDAISTGITAKKIIESYEAIFKKSTIFLMCIFYKNYKYYCLPRKKLNNSFFIESKEFLSKQKIFAICDAFSSEFVESKNCPDKDRKCKKPEI